MRAETLDGGAPPAGSGYIPALDGLRAVAILLVVAAHAGLEHLVPGAFGVTLFFFISGYLITRQLLGKLAAHGRIGLGGFYLRRVLRLLPAGAVYVAIAGGVYVALGGHVSALGWLAALSYGANIFDLWNGYRSTLAGVRHPFNILWSLAIEEHFYAVWPLVLGAVWRWRFLAVGVAVLGAGFLLHGDFARQAVRTSVQGAALMGVFPALLYRESAVRRVLSAWPALLVGRLSYSLYLWHWGAFALADYLAGPRRGIWLAIGLPLSAVLAIASYVLVERPMLRLRRRAGSHVAAG